MESKSSIRESNFELLRIVLMFMIVTWHLMVHGVEPYVELSNVSNVNIFVLRVIETLSVSGVNVFVLITGYFLIKSKNISFQHNSNKIVRLLCLVSFFSIVMYIFMLIFGITNFSVMDFFIYLLPTLSSRYWFVVVFVLLLLISPMLTIAINSLSTNTLWKYLLIFAFINSIWQYLFNLPTVGANNGYSLFHFVILFFTGALVRRSDFFSKIKTRYYLFSYFLLATVTVSILYYLPVSYEKIFYYNSPFVFIMSICLFLSFKGIKIKSEIINNISPYVFGVYIIHENSFISDIIWIQIGITRDFIYRSTFEFIILSLLMALSVFIVALFFSWILNNIFTIIYTYGIRKIESIINNMTELQKRRVDTK